MDPVPAVPRVQLFFYLYTPAGVCGMMKLFSRSRTSGPGLGEGTLKLSHHLRAKGKKGNCRLPHSSCQPPSQRRDLPPQLNHNRSGSSAPPTLVQSRAIPMLFS
ncbi:hypothetical protein ATANTOWER_009123 [Ataeniobius toweri]|uniref:Uncharacterized protein n=1 Tax=Ataeniobius toweri TaxID=208326 RepID=A0ABU7C0T2_9TELE|nr:hypothetical protein [Ataeniobius toweri]